MMKIILILIIICSFLVLKTSETKLIAKAINDVIDEFFVKKEIFDFEIFTLCNSNNERWKINEIINQVKSEKLITKVKSVKILKNQRNLIYTSTIGLFCSNSELNLFNSLTEIYYQSLKPVKVFVLSLEKLQKFSFKRSNKKTFMYQHVLSQEFILNVTKKSIELLSFEMYTEKKCKSPQLVKINSFDKKTQKWSKTLENYEKFQNFHGCLRVFVVEFGTGIKNFSFKIELFNSNLFQRN